MSRTPFRGAAFCFIQNSGLSISRKSIHLRGLALWATAPAREGAPATLSGFTTSTFIFNQAHLIDSQQQPNYAEKYFRFFRHFVQRNGHFLRLYNKARKQKRKKILTKTNSRK
jgi:hypothetical protein